MAKPFVSVLIDTYNHERFIEQAIISVLDQDFPASQREIILVDDGSTDRTPEIARKFEPQIRLICKKNGGQASAFNAGIPECRGEIIAFLDGDDWWEPGKLAAVVAEFEAAPEAGAIGHGIFEVDENGDKRNVIAPDRKYDCRLRDAEEGHEFLSLRAFLGTSRLAVRREILAKILPLPADLSIEADEFLVTVAAALGGARVLSQPLTSYRLHAGNLYQFEKWDANKARRKYQALACIVRELPARLVAAGISNEVARILIASVHLDAERIRLSLGEGWPWDTVRVEREGFRQAYRGETFGYKLFHFAVLGTALMLPPRQFYKLRRWYAAKNMARFRRFVGNAEPVSSLAVRKAAGS